MPECDAWGKARRIDNSSVHALTVSSRREGLLLRAPGHRRRSPASGSHRTWRADLPHHALRQVIYSTARACNSG